MQQHIANDKSGEFLHDPSCTRRRLCACCLIQPKGHGVVAQALEVEWRTIQNYGVEIDGQRYDGPGSTIIAG